MDKKEFPKMIYIDDIDKANYYSRIEKAENGPVAIYELKEVRTKTTKIELE